MGGVLLVMMKEMRATLRDPHVIAYLAFPILLYPALIWGVTQFMTLEAGRIEGESLRVAVEAPEVLRQRFDEPPLTLVAGTLDTLDAGEADAFVQLKDDGVLHATVHHSSLRPRSTRTRKAVRKRLDALRDERLVTIAESVGLDPAAVARTSYKGIAIEAPAQTIPGLVAVLLAAMTLISMTLAVIYPAVHVTVSEREAGTLETTLVAPVSGRTLLLGKWAACALWAVSAAAINALAVLLTLAHIAAVMLKGALDVQFSLLGALASVPAVLGAAGFTAATLLLFMVPARTFKQGEVLGSLALGPLMLAMGVGAWGAIEQVAWVIWVPLAGLIPVLRDALIGEPSLAAIAYQALATAGLGALILSLGAALVRREDFLFGGVLPRWIRWAGAR